MMTKGRNTLPSQVQIKKLVVMFVLEVVGNSLLRDKLPTSGYSKTIEQKTYVVDGKSYIVDITKYTRNTDPTSYFYVLSNTEKKIFMTNGENASNCSYL